MKILACMVSIVATTLGLTASAHAADLPQSGYDWTGFYLGANAGVAWNNTSVDNAVYISGVRNSELVSRLDGDQAAFTAGGLLGYNYQIDRIVLGVEADINYLGFGDDTSRNFSYNGLDMTAKSSFEADWFGTIRGRLGIAIDNMMLYGTGGVAYGNMKASGKVYGTDGVLEVDWRGSADQTNWGWTLGAGAEYGIDKWSLGLEYLYVDLGEGDWNARVINAELKGNADYAFSTVRATVKYHFQ